MPAPSKIRPASRLGDTLLQNRLYRGEVTHKDQIYPGQHEAIIDPELWQIVQDRLAANRQARTFAGIR